MLGQKIAERRQQLGLTQTDLALKIGIPPSRISAYENGTLSDCTLETAKRIAKALECTIDYLASDDAPGVPLPPPRRGRPRKTVPVAGASS